MIWQGTAHGKLVIAIQHIIQGLRFRFLGFRFLVLGFRVQGLGFGV